MARMQCFAVLAAAVAAQTPDMQVVRQRLLQQFQIQMNFTAADEDIDSFLPLIEAPGIFNDLNYTPGVPTGWGGYAHCTRMEEMVAVYLTPNCSHFKNATLLAAIWDVFGFWLRAQPQDPANWWYQMIGCGRPVGAITLQLQSVMSSEQVTNATTLMNLAQWISYTDKGTNAVDIGVVHICNGLVNNNETMVAEAFNVIYGTFQYAAGAAPTDPQGPKTDGSFMQHGPQLYQGNYGASWAKSAMLLISVTANTSYNASSASYDVVAHVTLDGCQRMMHFPSLQWDVAVIGRQVTNPGGQNVLGVGGDAMLIDPAIVRIVGGARGDEYMAFADRLLNPSAFPVLPQMTVFYATDYIVHTRAAYMASVRMISERTAGGECINGQGLQALHMADGVQYIYKTGFEYESIAPTWDWEKLPGTTVQHGGTQLNCSTADGNGQTALVGGVTDGITGLAFMDFFTSRYGQYLLARKSYFFFEGVFINLGANISTRAGYSVTTTLESRLLSGVVTLSTDGGASWSTVASGNHTYAAPTSAASPLLLLHDGIGYVVLGNNSAASATVHVLNAPVTGNWSSVGSNSGTQTNPMFTAWIDHGVFPSETHTADYAYYILPDTDAAAFPTAWKAATSRFGVWRNDMSVQAVYDTVNNTLMAVVYDNVSQLALPANLRANWIQLPFPMGFMMNVSVDQASGNDTLMMYWSNPAALVTLTHAYPYWMPTGGAYVACEWPGCPTQFPTPKNYTGPPSLKWNCYENGTIWFTNPPAQSSMPDGIIPPIVCAFL